MNLFIGVNPIFICKQHLLGIHGETHKFLHNWKKQYSIDGYIANNCIEPKSYKLRHDEIAAEMIARKMNHKSDLQQPDFSYLPMWQQEFEVDKDKALKSLMDRCPDCQERYNLLNN